MEEEPAFKSDTFQDEIELLIRFGMRKFYHKINLPRPLLSDNLLSKLICALVSFLLDPNNQQAFLSQIKQIIDESSSFPLFQKSLQDINQDLGLEYLWELASDLSTFYHEYLIYLSSSRSILDIEPDSQLTDQIQKSEKFFQDLSSCKPQNSRDTKPISFNLSDPSVAELFNQFIQAQSNCVPRCTVCRDPGKWFSYPCSHLCYCNMDYQSDLEGDLLEKTCPSCNQPIERYIYIDLDA